MLNRSKLYALLLLLGVFVTGTVVGGAVSAAWGDRAAKRTGNADRPPRRSYAERLEQELGLDAGQRDSIVEILRRNQEAMRDLWTETRPRMDTIRSNVRSEILSLLTDEQREAYTTYNARNDSVRAAHEPDAHRGRGRSQ
ncbi:MAG TPA: hypothetical protein VGA37_07900 [Gemmatimonadales bacterium]